MQELQEGYCPRNKDECKNLEPVEEIGSEQHSPVNRLDDILSTIRFRSRNDLRPQVISISPSEIVPRQNKKKRGDKECGMQQKAPKSTTDHNSDIKKQNRKNTQNPFTQANPAAPKQNCSVSVDEPKEAGHCLAQTTSSCSYNVGPELSKECVGQMPILLLQHNIEDRMNMM